MKRMVHPQHGWHHPMNSLDRENMLKNGWVDETVPELVVTVTYPDGTRATGTPPLPAQSPSEQAPKRRGRPPKVK